MKARIQNWNDLKSSSKGYQINTIWGARNSSSSFFVQGNYSNKDIMSDIDSDRAGITIENSIEKLLVNSLENLRIKKKGGRTRKTQKFNFFDLCTKRKNRENLQKFRKKKNTLVAPRNRNEKSKQLKGIISHAKNKETNTSKNFN